MTGVICKGIGGFYYVHDGEALFECRAKGIFRDRGEKPLVGDRVVFSVTDPDRKTGVVEELLPRKNTLIRPAVANMDQAFLVVTAASPAFHPLLADRFLLWMARQDVPVLLGINKCDLDKKGRGAEIRRTYGGAGIPILSFSARTGEGLEEVRAALKGKTTVLAGASGVGKSSLLNALIPDSSMETGTLSRRERGRHTTRHSEIFCLEKDSYLLDTPGFSSLDAPEMEPEEIRDYFPEFGGPARDCRFRDCFHLAEAECGVKRAAEAGLIPESRYESYAVTVREALARRKY